MSDRSDQDEIADLKAQLAQRDATIVALQQRLHKRGTGALLKTGARRLVPSAMLRRFAGGRDSHQNAAATLQLGRGRDAALFSNWHRAAGSRGVGFTDTIERQADGPAVAVSTVTHNSARWLDAFVRSLMSCSHPTGEIELVFVDNASTDGTLVRLREIEAELTGRFHSCRVIAAGNDGFGSGHDKAIRATEAPFVLVSNVDMEFDPGTITHALAVARADDEDVASWEFRQRPFEHPKYYDPVTLETIWSSHACVLLRRSVYEAVGGYEPRIFMYGEDVELSYRFRRRGYRLRYLPRATVHHHTYERANQFKPLQLRGSLAANMSLRARYGGWREIVAGLLLVTTLRPNGHEARDRALGEAKREAWRRLPYYLRTRENGDVALPFRSFDYEMAREGAFETVPAPVDPHDAPTVSVITRTYAGREALLRQAMASVLAQTWPEVEHIVVEDRGSTAAALVDEVNDVYASRVRHVASMRGGRSAAGNEGLTAATGRYVMFLDDDDLLFADHIETMVAALRSNGNAVAAYGLAWDVPTSFGNGWSGYAEKPPRLAERFRRPYDAERLRHENFIPIQTIVADRAALLETGGFHEDLDTLEDWNLWVRLSTRGGFVHVPKLTSIYRTPTDAELIARRQKLFDDAYRDVVARNADLEPGPLARSEDTGG